MHAAGVEFDDALFVGKSAEADAVVFGIVLTADADVVRSLECVGAVEEHLVCLLDRLVAGDAGDDDGFRRRLELLDRFGGVSVRVGFSAQGWQAEAGCSQSAKREEVAAGRHGGDVSKPFSESAPKVKRITPDH